MRELKFIVQDQIITKDPECDFDGLVPGTEQYLKAEFSFSSEWDNCVKVASFYSPMGREYEPQILKDGHSCVIPSEALAKRRFIIKLIGKGAYTITTNKIIIEQNGGK